MNPRLERLIEKHGLAGPDHEALVEDLKRLVGSMERGQAMAEHAFRISESTYQDALTALRNESDARDHAIGGIRTAIGRLLGTGEVPHDDLEGTIDLLKSAVQRTKELEAELVTARESADRAALAKSEFLAMVSHDIRTPLSVIVGTVYLLEAEAPPQLAELITPLRSACDTLLRLVNDLLDMRQIEEGRIVFERRHFDLHQVLHTAGDAAMKAGSAKGTQVKLLLAPDLPHQVMGDAHRLTQVLNNLLSNAVKFAAGGNVLLNAAPLGKEGGGTRVRFTVSDDGIGMSADELGVIFERFTQANRRIRQDFGGSGLGLAIIKRLLELQGSEIHVNSSPGKGTSFHFILGFDEAPQPQQEGIPLQPDNALHGKRVLVVDDQEAVGDVVAGMLGHLRMECTAVRSGAEALEAIKNKPFDVVLMDLQMPQMDGYETTGAMRRSHPDLPIIAMTAGVRNDIVDRTERHGMNGLVRKPLDLGVLVPLLLRVLGPDRATV